MVVLEAGVVWAECRLLIANAVLAQIIQPFLTSSPQRLGLSAALALSLPQFWIGP